MRYRIFGRRTGLRSLSWRSVQAVSASAGDMAPSAGEAKKFSMLTSEPVESSFDTADTSQLASERSWSVTSSSRITIILFSPPGIHWEPATVGMSDRQRPQKHGALGGKKC